MSQPVPWTALAIVVAGALIGLGLFLGLGRGSLSAQEVTAAPPGSPPPPAPSTGAAASAQQELAAWLESQRPLFISKCWEPSAALTPEPARVPFTFNLVVDAAGKEIGRGISEHREAFRADVGACLRDITDRPAAIAPPGQVVSVELTITLPN